MLIAKAYASTLDATAREWIQTDLFQGHGLVWGWQEDLFFSNWLKLPFGNQRWVF